MQDVYKQTLRCEAEHTFRHLLEHAEDGTGPDEGPGLEEVHGGREVCSHELLLLHFKQESVQPLLGISQHHLPTCLHGGLQLYKGLSLTRVWVGQATGQVAQEHTGHSHVGELQQHCHVPIEECGELLTMRDNRSKG